MGSLKEQAREAALAATWKTNPHEAACALDAANAASDVWAADYVELKNLLADESIAPLKRIDSAIAWIKESVDG